ncbi:hypothetical protein ACQCVL_17305 [Bacillus thuringiensis]|uniref:hypothetical protein n=1 Tax=Bacillus cereus group TaxID=86661 RepID=UPI00168121B3|nr:hypothetical protein [Bacillus cereus]
MNMKIKKRQLVATVYPDQLFSTATLPEGASFLKWELVFSAEQNSREVQRKMERLAT